jgi:hypothetical protein
LERKTNKQTLLQSVVVHACKPNTGEGGARRQGVSLHPVLHRRSCFGERERWEGRRKKKEGGRELEKERENKTEQKTNMFFNEKQIYGPRNTAQVAGHLPNEHYRWRFSRSSAPLIFPSFTGSSHWSPWRLPTGIAL